MRFTNPAIVMLLAVQGATLDAQVVPQPQGGTEVRITYRCVHDRHGCREKGRFLSATADSVLVRIDGRATGFPLTSVTQLETKTGRGISAGRALGYPVLGLLIGGLVGGLVGYTSCAPCDYELEGLVPLGMAVIGSGVGLVTGLVIGLVPRDRWENTLIDGVRLNGARRRGGGMQFGVSIGF